jgi:hypothetical protein
MASYNFDDPKLKHREVRLFPTVGIKGETEAEMRATAALLTMVRSVFEFGEIIIKQSGGPGGKAKNVHCYTEVSFLPDFPEDNEPARPDGIIYRKYGKKIWTALVEVKIGSNSINEKQIGTYLKWVKSLNFDALITISNQTTQPNGEPPYYCPKKYKKIKVKHFSWEKIHSIGQLLCAKDNRVSDVDQKWMLEQFNEYLADEKSKIIAQPTLGKSWHSVLKHIKANTINLHTDLAQNLVEHWFAFLRIASLKLGAKIGEDVRVRIPYKFKKNPTILIKTETKKTIETGKLTGELIFPEMNDIRLCVDIKKKELQISHKIDAPSDGRRDKRVKWIIREINKLKNVPSDLRIKVDWNEYGLVTSEVYEKLTDGIIPLLRGKADMQVGKNVLPRWFCLEHETLLQGARGKGSEQELIGILDDLENFYRLVQPINRPVKKPQPIQKDEEPTTVLEEEQNESI